MISEVRNALCQINLKASFVGAFAILFPSPRSLNFFIEFYAAFSICEIVPRGRDKNCTRLSIERIDWKRSRRSFNGIIEEGDSKRKEKKNYSFVSGERTFFLALSRRAPSLKNIEQTFDPRKYLPLTAVSFHWEKPSKLRASELSRPFEPPPRLLLAFLQCGSNWIKWCAGWNVICGTIGRKNGVSSEYEISIFKIQRWRLIERDWKSSRIMCRYVYWDSYTMLLKLPYLSKSYSSAAWTLISTNNDSFIYCTVERHFK